jgi:hypothetical protein
MIPPSKFVYPVRSKRRAAAGNRARGFEHAVASKIRIFVKLRDLSALIFRVLRRRTGGTSLASTTHGSTFNT